jgi:hypothetical protein
VSHKESGAELNPLKYPRNYIANKLQDERLPLKCLASGVAVIVMLITRRRCLEPGNPDRAEQKSNHKKLFCVAIVAKEY